MSNGRITLQNFERIHSALDSWDAEQAKEKIKLILRLMGLMGDVEYNKWLNSLPKNLDDLDFNVQAQKKIDELESQQVCYCEVLRDGREYICEAHRGKHSLDEEIPYGD